MATIPGALNPEVCPCAAAADGRVYPVERAARAWDERFSSGLVREVGEVLAAYGYPVIEDDCPDFYALMWCLWRFCYGHAGHPPAGGGTAAGSDREGGR
ncbi:hypothetical protein [Actinomadura sp. SCN-SB]|uniref:hypothetical protein n=1 Tax=Actinomadura sp. SCN-SB TaxID=3373092 RepID=UPI0037502D4F